MSKLIPAHTDADLSHIAPRLRGNAVEIKPLILDPQNPRRGDIELIAKSLDRHGQQQPVIVYQFPVSPEHPEEGYTVIAGNHRCKGALLPELDGKSRTPWAYIAVSEYVGTPQEAQEYAIIDNRSSDVAEYDDKILAKHLRDISSANADTDASLYDLTGYDEGDLTYFLSRMEIAEDQKDIDVYSSTESNPTLQKKAATKVEDAKDALKDDLTDSSTTDKKAHNFKFPSAIGFLNGKTYSGYPIFASSGKYEIPNLLSSMIAEIPDKPVRIWPGWTHRTEKNIKKYDALGDYWVVNFGYSSQNCPFKRAYLCFYALDEAFENIYDNAFKFLKNFKNSGIKAIIEPDYSMWDNEPFTLQMYAFYRMRWMSRLFQEVGIKIIPNVCTSQSFEHIYESMPYNPPLVSMQIQTGLTKKDDYAVKYYQQAVKTMLANIKPEAIIVYGSKYGHEVSEKWFPRQMHVIKVASVQDVRRQTYKKDPLRSLKTTDYN